MFFYLFIDTVKNICNKTLAFKFKRKRLLLSEKNKNYKAIGYARATHNEYEYLEKQIKNLKEVCCSLVFSELISLDVEIKPQLNKAINCLSKGDQLIISIIYLFSMLKNCSDICIKNNVLNTVLNLVYETKILFR